MLEHILDEYHFLTFLERAGHEIFTPLSIIKGGSEMILKQHAHDGYLPVRAEQMLTSIIGHTTILSRQVSDLLDVSALQHGALVLNVRMHDLVALVKEVVQDYRQSLSATPRREILLDISCDTMRALNLDAERIRRVISNYLSNALKYSPEHEPVTVGIEWIGEHVRVWVRDRGKGIPAWELERIWDQLYQVPYSQAVSGGSVGFGLGLYLCHAIVEQHQGMVGVQSTVNEGSTFWFTLPMPPVLS